MVMPVGALDRLDGRREKGGRILLGDARLHRPGDGRVLQDVRRHVRAQARVDPCRPEGFVDVTHRLAVPLDRMVLTFPGRLPAAQMGQQPAGNADGRLALVRLPFPRRATVEDASVEIDPTAACLPCEGGGADRARPGAGVERNENETRHMATNSTPGWPAFLDFAVAPCVPD